MNKVWKNKLPKEIYLETHLNKYYEKMKFPRIHCITQIQKNKISMIKNLVYLQNFNN
jgi:hypothetical protein